MTHEELIEKVARNMNPLSAKLVDMLIAYGAPHKDAIQLLPIDEAAAAIETIFAALRVPSEDFEPENISYHRGMSRLDWWQAMLNASPLAGEKRGTA